MQQEGGTSRCACSENAIAEESKAVKPGCGTENRRVGMVDNVMYIRSVPVKSNVRFVERAERVIEEYGKQAATPDEARELLNLNIQVYLFRKNGGVHRWTPPFFGPT